MLVVNSEIIKKVFVGGTRMMRGYRGNVKVFDDTALNTMGSIDSYDNLTVDDNGRAIISVVFIDVPPEVTGSVDSGGYAIVDSDGNVSTSVEFK